MDRLSKERRSEIMRRIRSKDTEPEMHVRRLIFALGYRYRLHLNELPGKPDISFRRLKKAIFVHGCFWHQHNSSGCKISHRPKSNMGYWRPKLERNKIRDRENIRALKRLGWNYLIIWECQTRNRNILARKIMDFLH